MRKSDGYTADIRRKLANVLPGEAILLPVPDGMEPRRFMTGCSAVAGQVFGRRQYTLKTTNQGVRVQRLTAPR